MDWSSSLQKLMMKFQRFMVGRYGVDTLGKHLTNLTLVLLIISFFFRSVFFTGFILILMIWTNYRMFSKKTYKRSSENRMYLQHVRKLKGKIAKLKDRKDYKYFKCPECQLQLRAPRKRGAIVVTCSRCKHKFDKKT